MAIQKELPLTTKGAKKPKAPTKKELVKMLEELDSEFIGTDISITKIQDFDEIILIGSGKGVTSVSKIDQLNWRRKKTVCYHKLNKIYNSLI